MAVVLVHQGPSLTQDSYEEVVRLLTDGGGLHSRSDCSARPSARFSNRRA